MQQGGQKGTGDVMSLTPKQPCRPDCERRKLGCRKECEAFAAYEKAKEEEYRRRQKLADANDYARQQIRRWQRKELRDKARGHGRK